ncbi:MAG: bifunctional folylpolyglutamate synthase/ dihydrofolate synthase [SAR324 cluster bacterium]|nr:bifunctional folylpolyglutamate synthase/ dihydrofolate synthase [SAR324 cluster bacterium]
MHSDDILYQQVLQQLEERGNYERSAQSRDISKLAGIQHLLKDLDEPHKSCQYIHIAGTNGKGLTGAMLSHILQGEGYTTGFYSSPHVIDIRERISINGQMVSKGQFAKYASRVLQNVKNYPAHIYLSYFDILTALAFLIFKEAQIEWAILETGLGGKADSTNVTEKKLSILTPISYDHMNVLGTSLEAIAEEKLGIVREHIPTVVAPQIKPLMPWLKKRLHDLGSPAVFAEELVIDQKNNGNYQLQWPNGSQDIIDLKKEGLSVPEQQCLQTALMAYRVLHAPRPDKKQRTSWCRNAMNTRLPGRLEYHKQVIWRKNKLEFPNMVFDGGHNAAALEALYKQLMSWNIKQYTLILGFAEDKMVQALKQPLLDLCLPATCIIITKAQSPRAASLERLTNFILPACNSMDPPPVLQQANTAEDALLRAYHSHPLAVIISGSFYLLGEIFQILEK